MIGVKMLIFYLNWRIAWLPPWAATFPGVFWAPPLTDSAEKKNQLKPGFEPITRWFIVWRIYCMSQINVTIVSHLSSLASGPFA